MRGTREEDDALEAALLARLLDLHPATLTAAELRREMLEHPDDFAQRDALARAVRDLAAAGLLNLADDLVVPSRAAVRFKELLGS